MNETIKNKILAEITNIRESETMEIKKVATFLMISGLHIHHSAIPMVG